MDAGEILEGGKEDGPNILALPVSLAHACVIRVAVEKRNNPGMLDSIIELVTFVTNLLQGA